MIFDLFAHADALVTDLNGDSFIVGSQAYAHDAAFGREFDGVADQIHPDVREKLLVGVIEDLVKLGDHFDVLFRPFGFLQKDALAKLFIQIEVTFL